MPSHPTPRGATLIESMVAMAVLLLGAAGMASLHSAGVRTEADSRRVTRAAALAQDLAGQIDLWPYGDPRLSNDSTLNDTDLADRGSMLFETSADPVADKAADHGEADLTKGGATWNGLPVTALLGEYERYWSVAYPDDSNANGVPDGARIAVVVRWRVGAGWRRVVLLSTKPNPAEAP